MSSLRHRSKNKHKDDNDTIRISSSSYSSRSSSYRAFKKASDSKTLTSNVTLPTLIALSKMIQTGYGLTYTGNGTLASPQIISAIPISAGYGLTSSGLGTVQSPQTLSTGYKVTYSCVLTMTSGINQYTGQISVTFIVNENGVVVARFRTSDITTGITYLNNLNLGLTDATVDIQWPSQLDVFLKPYPGLVIVPKFCEYTTTNAGVTTIYSPILQWSGINQTFEMITLSTQSYNLKLNSTIVADYAMGDWMPAIVF